MYYLIDEKPKIIFGWSPKSGCSHIKKIFWFLKTQNKNYPIHTDQDFNQLPTLINDYTTLVFCRNPYERLVSGFLDKYSEVGDLRHLWPKSEEITFSRFVDKLITEDWGAIEQHHFDCQTGGDFDTKIILSVTCKIYDIKNIDYYYIEELYNKKIDEDVLNFKFGHERRRYNSDLHHDVYDMNLDNYNLEYNVDLKYFYNDKLQDKVYNFYRSDFLFFKNFGIDYKLI